MPSRWTATAGAAALVAGLVATLPAGAGRAATNPAATRSATPVSCPLSWTKFTGNRAYPDTSASYWTVKFPVVSGGHLAVDGTFPHARYMSFNSYQKSAAYDVVEDDILTPNDGAPNPFQGGNPRNNTVTYDMTVAFASTPANPAKNTLYTGPATAPANQVTYRVYVPDQGQDDTGGVGLPSVTFYAPAGTSLPPECSGSARRAPATAAPAARSLAAATPTNPPTWFKSNTNDGYGNLDNAYLSTPISTQFGQVLVIHAKAPTFPATYQGEATFQGGTQLRYWSMCENNPKTTGVIGCAPDYLSNVSGGYYTIVIAKTQPTNTGPSCGDVWVPWGAVQTGELLLRNMLPAGTFAHSVQQASNGQLKKDMGGYYPSATYVATVSAFEKLGCPPDLSGLHLG